MAQMVTMPRAVVVGLLDAVEDRVSVAALRMAQGVQAQTEEARVRAMAQARLALRRANRALADGLADLRRGETLRWPEPHLTGREDEQREVDWLNMTGGRS